MTDAWQEGFEARGREESIHANPYTAFTREHSAWVEGFFARDEHERDKGDALDSIGWNG